MSLRPSLVEYSSNRSRHLVFLVHIWLCVPFMLYWLNDRQIQTDLGNMAVDRLRPMVLLVLLYLVARTWLALKNPEWLKWDYYFPPIDVVIISTILYLSERGPMSSLTLLVFLPIVEAAGTLKVRWAGAVGLMVVVGLAVSMLPTLSPSPAEALPRDAFNVSFRLFFLLLFSSLITYQAAIAAEFKEKLGVVADRNRIALEMHDGVQGSLISLASMLELIGHVAPRDGERASAIAKEGRETARQAADELRFLVQRLRGPSLEQGFIPALRQYAHNICDRHDLRLEFQVVGPERALDPDKENALFRIAQEALNNVVKHARASQVDIRVLFTEAHVKLEVKDDGVGFRAQEVQTQVGLPSMRERAEKTGGEVLVNSDPGAGTSVIASL